MDNNDYAVFRSYRETPRNLDKEPITLWEKFWAFLFLLAVFAWLCFSLWFIFFCCKK